MHRAVAAQETGDRVVALAVVTGFIALGFLYNEFWLVPKAKTRESCLANLAWIEQQKVTFYIVEPAPSKPPTATELIANASGYLHAWPQCPVGGVYMIGTKVHPALCTIHGSIRPRVSQP